MKQSGLFLFFTGLMCLFSCANDSLQNTDDAQFKKEVLLHDDNPVIETVVDDIRFKFCLLDKDNVPANSFKVGENFSFCLEMENQQDAIDLKIVKDFIYELSVDGFGKVISPTKGVIGNPFAEVNCTEEFRTFPFFGEDKLCKIVIPWIDRERLFSPFPFCFGISPQPALAKGVYYTEVSHEFSFYVPPKTPEDGWSWLHIGPLTFKINFEIN
ncbi:MAG: hypothetical protein LBT25_13410 [Candidatus Symbiothrix sp.]|jgi:hypothetical protein|nr:hypothetical protein [Candidatus Symbiothrix sp.]